MDKAFVIRTDHEGFPVEGVHAQLVAGRARIGWSELDSQDLRFIQRKLEQGHDLDEDQKSARRCLRFLTKVGADDLLLYPHQPERGQFMVVQVTGDYGYDGGLGEDFRSFRPCKLVTPKPVALYDEIVPSSLRQRMGIPGRLSEVSDTGPLRDFLDRLPESGRVQDGTNRVAVDRIHEKLRKLLPDAIHQEFSRADLSRKLCAELFDRMGYSYELQEGPAEAGSDIVLTVGDRFLLEEFRVGVQIFSYKDSVDERALEEKLRQLLQGWERNGLDSGVLLTTGRCDEKAAAMLRRHNTGDRPVRLIDGDEFADLFMQHFPPRGGA